MAARDSYGRLLALLAASTSDLAAAEDALADAFERALRTWPSQGVPGNPDAWLLTVARNRLRDERKSARAQRAVSLEAGRDALARTLSHVPELSDEELGTLVKQATVDAYGDDEQLGGFAVMIEDNLEVPFDTTVLGVAVTVQKVTQTESGIVADCVRDGHHQAISVLDLPLPEPPPKGAQWIAAYRHWAGGM